VTVFQWFPRIAVLRIFCEDDSSRVQKSPKVSSEKKVAFLLFSFFNKALVQNLSPVAIASIFNP